MQVCLKSKWSRHCSSLINTMAKPVSNVMARSLQDLNLLRTKVTQLLTLTLTSKPMAKLLTSRAQTSSTTHLPLPSPRSQTPAQKFSFGPLINPKAIESTPGGSSPPRTPPKAKEPGQTTAMRSSTQRGVEEDKRTAPVGQKKIYTAEQADRIRNELKGERKRRVSVCIAAY